MHDIFVAALFLTVSASADDDRGTAEEARDMVARAIALYDTVGATEALVKFNTAPSPEFRKGDLYIFVYDPGGMLVAHGVDQSPVGTSYEDIVDETGKKPGIEMWERADGNGVWVDYRWPNPVTGAVEDKSSWVVRHDGYVFGAGIYTAN